MCDFSRFGGKSPEQQRLEATLSAPPEMSMEMLQKATNDTREAPSCKAMESLSSQVAVQDYSIPTRDGYTIQCRTYRPAAGASEGAPCPIYANFTAAAFSYAL